MDRERFDALARVLATTGSRRGALGAVLGAAVFGQTLEAGGAKPDTAKRKGRAKGRANDRGNGKKRQRADRRRRQRDQRTQAEAVCFTGSPCIPGPGTNLGKCDFGGPSTTLKNKNLKGANLGQANLARADASGANFAGANLDKACLVDANLTGATINGSTNISTAIRCRTTMPDGSIDNSGCTKGTACCPTCDAQHLCPAGQVCSNGRCRTGACVGADDCATQTCQTTACVRNQCVYTPVTGGACPAPGGGGGQCCGGQCCAATQVCDTRPNPDVCCTRESDEAACEGQCGDVVNNCGQPVECDPCLLCDVCADGCDFTTIQDAVDAAAPGDTITVCPGAYTENVVIEIDGELTIVGAGQGDDPANDTILDGNESGTAVTISAGTVTLQNLRITGGSNTEDLACGGGITNEGTLTLSGSTVTGNAAFFGGGICSFSGALTLIDSTITLNEGFEGGGIATGVTTTLTNSDVTVNTAANTSGGIYNFGELTFDAASSVTGNIAGATDPAAGGILNQNTVTCAAPGTVTGNSPDQCVDDGGTGCAGCN